MRWWDIETVAGDGCSVLSRLRATFEEGGSDGGATGLRMREILGPSAPWQRDHSEPFDSPRAGFVSNPRSGRQALQNTGINSGKDSKEPPLKHLDVSPSAWKVASSRPDFLDASSRCRFVSLFSWRLPSHGLFMSLPL